MQIQKIANYEQRKQQYRDELKTFWLVEFTAFAVIDASITFCGMYGLHKIGIEPDLDWRLSALLMWLLMLILPVKMLYPEKPCPSDILRDRALRRAAGMDDTVEESR